MKSSGTKRGLRKRTLVVRPSTSNHDQVLHILWTTCLFTKKFSKCKFSVGSFPSSLFLQTNSPVFTIACRSYSDNESAELNNLDPGKPREEEIITAASLNPGENVSEAVNEDVSDDDSEKLCHMSVRKQSRSHHFHTNR